MSSVLLNKTFLSFILNLYKMDNYIFVMCGWIYLSKTRNTGMMPLGHRKLSNLLIWLISFVLKIYKSPYLKGILVSLMMETVLALVWKSAYRLLYSSFLTPCMPLHFNKPSCILVIIWWWPMFPTFAFKRVPSVGKVSYWSCLNIWNVDCV